MKSKPEVIIPWYNLPKGAKVHVEDGDIQIYEHLGIDGVFQRWKTMDGVKIGRWNNYKKVGRYYIPLP